MTVRVNECPGSGRTADCAGVPRTSRSKWCSERCRKQTLYHGSCVDCGAPTNGYDGPGKASERCLPCRSAKATADAFWTRDQILADGHRWHVLTGRWPITGDWNRPQNRGERRVLIDELHHLTGPWPHIDTVQKTFGSWREYVEALGGAAFPVHSGAPGQAKTARTAELRKLVEGLRV